MARCRNPSAPRPVERCSTKLTLRWTVTIATAILATGYSPPVIDRPRRPGREVTARRTVRHFTGEQRSSAQDIWHSVPIIAGPAHLARQLQHPRNRPIRRRPQSEHADDAGTNAQRHLAQTMEPRRGAAPRSVGNWAVWRGSARPPHGGGDPVRHRRSSDRGPADSNDRRQYSLPPIQRVDDQCRPQSIRRGINRRRTTNSTRSCWQRRSAALTELARWARPALRQPAHTWISTVPTVQRRGALRQRSGS